MKLRPEHQSARAWFLIACGWRWQTRAVFSGPVEVDAYMGGKMKNMHGKQRREAQQDYGKTIVAGARDRATGAVRAQAIEARTKRP